MTMPVDCGTAADGAPSGMGGPFICLGGNCVQSYCGDGYVNTEAEACDDGNTTNNDGCDADCTVTCTDPAVDCVDDGDVCNGVAICESNVCSQTAPMMQGEACVATSGEDGTCQPQSGSLACVPTGCEIGRASCRETV